MEAPITKNNNKRYSADKKAKAPSLMLREICCMVSVPESCFLTQMALVSIKRRPTTANTIGK